MPTYLVNKREESMKPNLSVSVLSVLCVLFSFTGSVCAYTARNYYGAKFEPFDTVMHTGGLDPGDFNDYWHVMDPGEYPAGYMAYCNLTNPFVPGLRDTLNSYVQNYDVYLPVQLGLYIVNIEDQIAAGLWDKDIEGFCRDLKQLGYPLLIRIGYECNGAHNGYDANDYKAAFIRITNALRANNVEAATVFNIIPDSEAQYMPYYPGDAYVDWWAINIFSAWASTTSYTTGFCSNAHSHGKPVLIGEASPADYHTTNGWASWFGWFVPYFNLIDSQPGIKNFCYINYNWPDGMPDDAEAEASLPQQFRRDT